MEDISLCRDGCFCMTKTIQGKCGKCGVYKNGRKNKGKNTERNGQAY